MYDIIYNVRYITEGQKLYVFTNFINKEFIQMGTGNLCQMG